MADNKKSSDPSAVIGAIIGLPFMLFFLVLWSPLLILAAVANLFSSEPTKPTSVSQANGQQPGNEESSKLGFLLVAGVSFAVFVWLLSGGLHGSGGSTSGGGGGYNPRPVYQPTGGAVWVNGYYRADGTFVPGHYRSQPDGDPSNNWSTYPNVNPYSGQQGSRKSYGK